MLRNNLFHRCWLLAFERLQSDNSKGGRIKFGDSVKIQGQEHCEREKDVPTSDLLNACDGGILSTL